MTRLAITGHRGLPPATEKLIDTALRHELARRAGGGDLVGLSCLADGADSLFARALLDAGGTLIVIVPAAEYRAGLPEEHHATYDALPRIKVPTLVTNGDLDELVPPANARKVVTSRRSA